MYRVFLVDDEPFILEGLYDAVDWAAHGLELTGKAENGRKALELLQQVPADLLITDISMPIMNGLELIRAARAIRPELKVIILSGFNDFEYLKEGMQLGIENYLLKPLNFAELTSTLAHTVKKLDETRRSSALEAEKADILKDTILYRWLTAAIDAVQLQERAAMLDISFSGRYISTMLLRGGSEREDGLLQELRQTANASGDRLFLQNVEGDAVLVFMAEEEADCAAKAMQFALQLRQREEARPYRISIGSPQARGAQEALSYEHALRAQEYFLLLHKEEIALYEDYAARRDELLPDAELNWASYRKKVSAADTESLVAELTGDFQAIQASSAATPSRLRMLVMQTLLWLHQEMGGANTVNAIIAEHMNASFNKAAKASEWEELLAIMTSTIRGMSTMLIKEKTNPTVKLVLNDVEKFFATDLSLKLLAHKYHIHPVYLGKLFQKETGESFTEYVNKHRIEQSKLLLRTTALKVHEISRNVGYWDSGYFHKQFKKYVGVTPADYKSMLFAASGEPDDLNT